MCYFSCTMCCLPYFIGISKLGAQGFDSRSVSKHSMSISFMWPLTSVILSP